MTEGSTHAPAAPVRNGIDVLAEDDFRELRDMRIAILTNHSGTLLDGSRTIDALFARDEFMLEKIFTPEHGLSGVAADGQSVADGIDDATGLAVFSLFGDRDRPAQEQLEGLTALLFDVQDVGCRFYTYETTLGYALEACAEARVRVYVLDRPNPLNGLEVDGPSSDPSCESFVNYHPMPLRHGLTIGELARLFNGEREIGADLRVATMAGWQRDLWQDQTGQPWADPSPAIRDLTAAALYPAVGLLEGTNISVGRGTPEPFHIIGAPWIDGEALQKKLERAELPGMRYAATTFVPQAKHHPHFGVQCNGVRLLVEDNGEIAVGPLSLALIRALRDAYPHEWEFRKLDRLLARPDLLDAIEDDAAELDDLWEPDPDFFDSRAKYLLY